MKVSDEMVEKAAKADAEFAGRTFDALGSADKKRFIERANIILKAALSAADPVRWMWEERRFAESDIWDDMYDDEPPAPHKYVRNIRPLFASPVLGWELIDTAPKDGSTILGAYADKVLTVRWEPDGYENRGGKSAWIDGSFDRSEEYFTHPVTHWMPLPSAPTPAKQEA